MPLEPTQVDLSPFRFLLVDLDDRGLVGFLDHHRDEFSFFLIDQLNAKWGLQKVRLIKPDEWPHPNRGTRESQVKYLKRLPHLFEDSIKTIADEIIAELSEDAPPLGPLVLQVVANNDGSTLAGMFGEQIQIAARLITPL